MTGVYGEAAAGGRTATSLTLTGEHPAQARDAWWATGSQWAAFTRGMLFALAAEQNADFGNLTLEAWNSAKVFDGSMPWIVGEETLKAWASAQQKLRDFASAIALKIQEPSPTPPEEVKVEVKPPSGGGGGFGLVVGGLGLVAGIAGVAFGLSKAKNFRHRKAA